MGLQRVQEGRSDPLVKQKASAMEAFAYAADPNYLPHT